GRARRLVHDLPELILAVERKALHAVLVIRAADRFARLHGMHEVELRARDRRRVLDLGKRGNVEMTNAGAIECADQEDRAVGLISVRHVAREIVQEPARGAAGSMGTGTKNGTLRLTGGNEIGRRSM